MEERKKCPMKFCISIDVEGEVDYCSTDSCAWWDKALQECYVATVGRSMNSIHKDLGYVIDGLENLSKEN